MMKPLVKIETTPRHRLVSSLLVSLIGFVAAWRISPNALAIFGVFYVQLLSIALCYSWAMDHRGLGFIRAFAHEVAPGRTIFIFTILVSPFLMSDAEIWTFPVFGFSLIAAAVLCAFNDAVITLDLVLKERGNS